MGITNLSLIQKIGIVLLGKDICPISLYNKIMKDAYKDEFKRLYGEARIDKVIQFSGYEHRKIIMYSKFDGPKYIYVHSDMINEIKTKGNQNYKALKIKHRRIK